MKYYCLGIKGSGMATLANILYDLGNDVEGYDDVKDYKFTQEGLDKRNIKIYSDNTHPLDKNMILTHSVALKENHKRFYARDYDTEAIYSKLNGEIYTFKDNYAVNRIPLNTANVKSIIFEGAYMSNKDEFKWYWQDNNWYKVSEAKIEVYVNSLGITYNPDNSSCL